MKTTPTPLGRPFAPKLDSATRRARVARVNYHYGRLEKDYNAAIAAERDLDEAVLVASDAVEVCRRVLAWSGCPKSLADAARSVVERDEKVGAP